MSATHYACPSCDRRLPAEDYHTLGHESLCSCLRVRLGGYKALWLPPIVLAGTARMGRARLAPATAADPHDLHPAVAQAARYRAALLRIRDWPGDCVDHAASIGSPNPHEIAAETLEDL